KPRWSQTSARLARLTSARSRSTETTLRPTVGSARSPSGSASRAQPLRPTWITCGSNPLHPIAQSSFNGCAFCVIRFVTRRPAMLEGLVNAAAAALLIGAAAVPANAAMHATEEFKEGTTRPRSVAFLPPHAMLLKRKVVQTEQQIEESLE